MQLSASEVLCTNACDMEDKQEISEVGVLLKVWEHRDKIEELTHLESWS